MTPPAEGPSPVLDAADPTLAVRAALCDGLALQLALALRPAAASELLRRTGSLAAARAALGAKARRAVPASALEALQRVGAVGVPLLSPLYPPRLARLPDPAPLLWVRGSLEALSAPCVAIVGSRAATAYGLAIAAKLSSGLAGAGVVIVSGLARGIDAAAHRAALEAGGTTVAVQGCGPELVYPPEHGELAERIAERGALVSEFPPGAPALAYHFPLRNRLISGLASAVIVVEARERSGSLLTAAHALDQGSEVFAVPGPVSAPTSAGPNRLLRDGAHVVLEPEDVLVCLDWGARAPARREPRSAPPSDPRVREILAALRHEPATRDELSRRLGRTPEQLALNLLELELEGHVAEDRDGRLRAL